MVKLDKVKWGFIGCGEVTEKKKRTSLCPDRRFRGSGRNEP